jgi:hypothetical protein
MNRVTFNADIHTKELLMRNQQLAFSLAGNSPEFAQSPLSEDLEILSLTDDDGRTLASEIAIHQPTWMLSEAAKSHEVLRITNKFGSTVAHCLAECQPDWVHSAAAKSHDILTIANPSGWTVAHTLALCNPAWLSSEAAKKYDVLLLATQSQRLVAIVIAMHQPESINHEPLLNKNMMTLQHNGQLLAEHLVKHAKNNKSKTPSDIIMTLISQGAAYKQSSNLENTVGLEIIQKSKNLVEDGGSALIGLKQLLALYSTLSHQVSNISSAEIKHHLTEWQNFQSISEEMLRQHLTAHPELFDIEHTTDIFCEPGDDLLRRIMAEQTINTTLSDVFQAEHIPPAPEQGLY